MIRRDINLHGLDTTVLGADLEVEYVYPGTIDVDVSDSVRVTSGRDAQVMTLGHCPGEPSLTAALALDASRWTWRSHTRPKAQIWVRHVFAADLARQNLWYEFEGQVVLIWHDLPTRESELALLAADFRPSLATWRAPATADARALVRELVGAPVANGRSPAFGTMPANQPAAGDAQDRAQNAWMRWAALFGDKLDVGDRVYRLRGRPRLRGERLTIELLDRKSTLRVHMDVGLHPLVVRAHFDLDGRLLEVGGLAWADFPHAIADLTAFRVEARSQRRRTSAADEEPVSIENAPPDKPGTNYAEAGAGLRALGLPRSDYLRYKRQAEKAIEQGKSYLPVIRRAQRKADKLRSTQGAAVTPPHRRPGTQLRTWPELVVDAFNAAPGPRLAFARRHGPVTIFVVYPEQGSEDRPLASVDVDGSEIEDVRWLDDRMPSSTQELIEARLEHALEITRSEDDPEVKSPPPLDGLIELMRRRGRELGVDPEEVARPGRSDEYARIATVLAELSDRTGTTAQELAGWLIGHGLHRAGEMVEAFVNGDEPIEPFIVNLWYEITDDIGAGEIIDAADGFRVPVTALFDHGHGHTAVLLVREAVGRGAYLLRRVSVVVRDCEGDDDDEGTCGVEDPEERLQGGQTVWLRTGSLGSDFYRELHERVRSFEESVRRAPRTLQDVRVLLYWTAAMIESPRCQGDLKQAVFTALEEAKHYYDLAARRLGERRDADAVTRMHEALRRISTAAAELARNCAEGQEALVRPTLPARPEDIAIFGEPHGATATARWGAPLAPRRMTRDPGRGRLVSQAATRRRVSPMRVTASARPEAGALGRTRTTASRGSPEVSAEEVLARMDRLLRIYSGGGLAGRIVRATDLCLVVQGSAGDPEFPTLTLPDVASRTRALPGREIATILPSPPCVHYRDGEASMWLDHLLSHVQPWALDSVLGRATPCIHHIELGRGAWEAARMNPIARNHTCSACPFVLGTNLDCPACRSWILALKGPTPGSPWSIEDLRRAIEPWCGSDASPAATAAYHALGSVKDGAFLSRPFFQAFAAEFAAGLAGTVADAPGPREHCRLCVEALFVRPDFPIVDTLEPGEYEAWIARFGESLGENGLGGERADDVSARLAAETLRTWRQTAMGEGLFRRLVAQFDWLRGDGLDHLAIERIAREAEDMTGGPAAEPGEDEPPPPKRVEPRATPARREGRY